MQKLLFISMVGLLTAIFLNTPLAAQSNTETSDFWQEPWEGVPDHYQNWNYPDFTFPEDLAAWEKDRIEVRETIQKLLGEIPPRPEHLKVKTVLREEKNGYILEKFLIDNEVDSWIPGYLAIPTNVKGKVPVILGLHGHGSSKDNIFGSDPGTSQDVLALFISNGYAVMAIDSYFNGERRGRGPAGDLEMQESRADQESSLFKINLWFGRSLWGMQLRDEQIALDYLMTRSEIDTERIGVEGMSMGSTRAWWLAALDERIKVVVGIACFTRYKELIEQRQLRAHGIYYFVPGMLNHFDTEALMGLIAPRPFLALTGDRDHGSPLSGIRVLEKKLNTVYDLYNKVENFNSIVYEDTGHVFTDEMKIEMLNWFDNHLKSYTKFSQ
ncbi:MAG: alpha/beta hydrolase family protein [Bacteroidales bacterium]